MRKETDYAENIERTDVLPAIERSRIVFPEPSFWGVPFGSPSSRIVPLSTSHPIPVSKMPWRPAPTHSFYVTEGHHRMSRPRHEPSEGGPIYFFSGRGAGDLKWSSIGHLQTNARMFAPIWFTPSPDLSVSPDQATDSQVSRVRGPAAPGRYRAERQFNLHAASSIMKFIPEPPHISDWFNAVGGAWRGISQTEANDPSKTQSRSGSKFRTRGAQALRRLCRTDPTVVSERKSDSLVRLIMYQDAWVRLQVAAVQNDPLSSVAVGASLGNLTSLTLLSLRHLLPTFCNE